MRKSLLKEAGRHHADERKIAIGINTNQKYDYSVYRRIRDIVKVGRPHPVHLGQRDLPAGSGHRLLHLLLRDGQDRPPEACAALRVDARALRVDPLLTHNIRKGDRLLC